MGLLREKLLDMALASGVAVGLGVFLCEFAKVYPGKFGGYKPNVVTTSLSSAMCIVLALVIFRKRTPEAVEVRKPVVEGDDTLPTFTRGQHWTMDATQVAKTAFARKGHASMDGCPPLTIIQAFEQLLKEEGKANWFAMTVERPVPPPKAKGVAPSLRPEEWTSWTYSEYYHESTLAAMGFMHYGLEMYGSVCIWGFNSPEWHMSVIGAILAGGKAAGIYPTDSIEQVKYKMRHSGCAVAVVEDVNKLERVLSIAQDLPDLRAIVICEYSTQASVNKVQPRNGLPPVKVTSWAELCSIEPQHPDVEIRLEERKRRVQPGNCCALVYTSGTTGNPKAVMISHDNVVFESLVLREIFRGIDVPSQVRLLSYLPLSHVAGMLVDIFLPILNTLKLDAENTTFFARPYDLKEGTLRFRLQFVRPSFFIGVPRVYEKIAEKLRDVGASISGLKRTISIWAKSKGYEHALACQLGGDGSFPPMYAVAEALILKMIKQQLGLGEAIFCVSAAAPITMDTLQYFGSLSVPILEMYGMSESTGATTMCTVRTKLWGSCGFAMAGTEVAILTHSEDGGAPKRCPLTQDLFHPRDEEQGEVCYRGRHIMMGYMANPSLGQEHMEEIARNNAEAIDEYGWLHSGDKGTMDTRGMVRITGRYKELIIGAGGENIAPVPIEDFIKYRAPAVSNVMMVGDKKKFNVVLLTLKAVGATGELSGTNQLLGPAKDVNPKITTTEEAAQDPIWRNYLTSVIMDTNKNPSVVASNAAAIQKFAILPRDFSVEGGELTPTFKLRRAVACKIWEAEIDRLYA